MCEDSTKQSQYIIGIKTILDRVKYINKGCDAIKVQIIQIICIFEK